MKGWERLAAYGLLALMGLIWWRAHDAGVRAEALAQVRRDSLHTVTVALDHAEQRRIREDAQARDSLARLRTQAARWKARADSLAALDSLRPTLALKDSVIAAQRGRITAIQAIVSLTDTRWRAADSAATAWRTLALGAQTQPQARRSRFTCVGGLGAAGGLGGSAMGLAVACGVSVR